jgi:PhzF family phenazine biosynthesis protein
MKIKVYQVDAFTDRLFSGNPAAVCPLDGWISDSMMQNIAMENNLSETVFYVKEPPLSPGGEERYRIRWFTPALEVILCGHATLAASHIMFNHEGYSGDEILFNSLSGPLKVTRDGNLITLDFPADIVQPSTLPDDVMSGLNIQPVETWKGKTDYLLVYNTEQEIKDLKPDFRLLALAKARGIIVTSKGDPHPPLGGAGVDFVSRFFAPASGINEDPVTGFAHTLLTPYWSKKLGKKELSAIQLSARKGHLQCSYPHPQSGGESGRVLIGGYAKTYLQGSIEI